MNEKTFLEKVRDLLKIKAEDSKEETTELEATKEVEETTKVELASMKLEDGTVIEAEAFEAGNGVFIMNEEERVPLPVGEYKLEDGMVLVVEEEGVIASMGEAKAEEVVEEDMAQEYVTMEQLQQVLHQFSTELEALRSLIDGDLLSKTEKVEELSKEKVELETKLDEPAVEPLTKAPVKKDVKMAETKKGRILDTISNLKNN